MKRKGFLLAGIFLLTCPLALVASVNESVYLDEGGIHDGDLSTVNGKVTVGDGATVRGRCSSVNGGIIVGINTRTEGLSSVNGRVRVGAGSEVDGEVSSVNGAISFDEGARADHVGSVNGGIELNGAEIARDVRTVNGDIKLRRRAVIGGSIVIEETHGRHDHRSRPLQILIEDGSVVRGDIIVEDSYIEVEVHLRSGGRVDGRIENARVIED